MFLLRCRETSATGYPGQWWTPHPWRELKSLWIWYLGTWISDGFGTPGRMVGLDDLRGLFQPRQYSDFLTRVLVDTDVRFGWISSRHSFLKAPIRAR